MKIKRKLISILLILSLVITSLMATVSVSSAASTPQYWIKVNAQANVVTVYKKTNGQWEPFRAMLCSTGIGNGENKTPTGTFYIKGRWHWGYMVGDVYARYCVHFYKDYLFHSVPYNKLYDKKSQPTKEYNKLGKDASHGCVRLSTMDARWVYNNCKRGTKVTIYNSSNPGPLGKPAGIKVNTSRKTYWDPTDPDKKNPYYKLKKPVISVSSSKKLAAVKGSSYNLKAGMIATDPNTFQNISGRITVAGVKRYSSEKKAYVKASFSTSKLGTYKVTYKVQHPYSGTSTKTIKIRVVNKILKAPVVTASNRSSDGSPVLTWKAVPGASKYEIYRATSKTGTYKKIYTATGTSCINIYSTSGSRYYYKVKAIAKSSSDQDSGFSKVVYRTRDLPQPVITAAGNTSDGDPKLSWKAVPGASKYVVYRSAKEKGTYKKMYTTIGTSYINTASTESGVCYYYKVAAISPKTSAADSAYSKIVSVTCDLP